MSKCIDQPCRIAGDCATRKHHLIIRETPVSSRKKTFPLTVHRCSHRSDDSQKKKHCFRLSEEVYECSLEKNGFYSRTSARRQCEVISASIGSALQVGEADARDQRLLTRGCYEMLSTPILTFLDTDYRLKQALVEDEKSPWIVRVHEAVRLCQ